MIDRHWDGIAAYCRPENKVSLGFVEGLNNKIRVIQRPDLRAAGAVARRGALHLFLITDEQGRALSTNQTSRDCIAVDMMDNASALPTCPQRQQK
jgi:hypothetical protein